MKITEKQKELLIEFCKFIDKKENIDTENESIKYNFDKSIESLIHLHQYQPIYVYENNKNIHFFMFEFNENNEIENTFRKHDTNNDDVFYYNGKEFKIKHLTRQWTKFLRKKKLNELKNGNN